MNSFLVILAAMTGFALSACAADPHPRMIAPIKRAVTPPGGQWQVAEATAAGAAAAGGATAPYLGQRLRLAEKDAGHPSGRTCPQPGYMGWEGSADSVLGIATPGGDSPRPVMEITCGDEMFGTYVGLADGRLATRVNDWVLILVRAGTDSARPETTKAEPIKAPTAKAEQTKAEPAKSEKPKAEPNTAEKPKAVPTPPAATGASAMAAAGDNRTLVYLASYRTEAQAHAGWRVLARKSPILARQQPIVTSVVLERRNNEKWVRLYGLASDESERAAICGQLGKLVDECGSRLRE